MLWYEMIVECAKGQHHSCEHLELLSQTHARVKVKCAQTCATRQDREKCACDKVSTPLRPSPFAYKGIAIDCKRNPVKKNYECASLGVHAIESLDVRVATNFVKMMKR